MPGDDSARDQLTNRQIPQMELSKPLNPLNAPGVLPTDITPLERAKRRFGIQGNAIVTGGSGGIGLIVIRALLEHGASGVAVFDIPGSLETAKDTIETLRSDFTNARILTLEVDVRDHDLVESSVQEVVDKLGSVDMLLCLAGVVHCGHALETLNVDWRRVMDVNVTGSWLCAQAVGKRMVAQQTGGSIVLTASISAHRVNFPQPQVAYNTSKAAILQLMRSLAAEWAVHGIRVNSISPGYMDTILNHGEGLEECRNVWASRNPMARMGNPEELTGPIVLLLSSVAGKYINGADVVVDGGGIIF
ncbi:putative secondary metabolism biosynthetic enzyme [Marasmius oreades]|uniref:D-arabinitol 2-dehydrogenase [ribulose-forming] n=1 Tax=Marasmius oreades TaxID=181124 RepID=A0A9P7S572_9AGAR|nr:putative secondary metabolism biosynthetic enzyme [Marasmius oreades]KAG7094678.1 putative secondary metabolism biosynthetic enzyme [Marasmius oreades]